FAAPQPTNLNTYLLKLDWNVTADAKHRIFVRGNLQSDRTEFAPQFPGQPPSHVQTSNNKGISAGYTALLSNTLINNFRYGFIRQGVSDSGRNPYSNVGFWNVSDQVSFQRTLNVNVPVHQLVDDISWTRGKHTLQFGGNWRIVNNNRLADEQNYLFGSMQPTWRLEGGIAGTGQDLDPSISGDFPAVDPNFAFSYDAAVTNVAGVMGSISATYNQTKDGFVATGALVPRHFKNNEVEFYAQDSW